MVTLPKNCRVTYTNNSVHVRMTYSTELEQGVYDGITVWQSRPYVDKNGKHCNGRRYFALEFTVDYQKNLPTLITEAYFEFKKKAMMWNRSKKIERYQKENDILSNSKFAGTWDIWHLKQNNQLPNPPKQLSIF